MANAKSNKAKGRNGQKEISKILLDFANQELGANLTEDDFRSNPMGSDGEDILLSSVSRKLLPWCIEIKRQKKSTVEKWMQQARSHGEHIPVVFSRQDKKSWNVTIELDYFLSLIKQQKNNSSI